MGSFLVSHDWGKDLEFGSVFVSKNGFSHRGRRLSHDRFMVMRAIWNADTSEKKTEEVIYLSDGSYC